jgi:hypothetical protein
MPDMTGKLPAGRPQRGHPWPGSASRPAATSSRSSRTTRTFHQLCPAALALWEQTSDERTRQAMAKAHDVTGGQFDPVDNGPGDALIYGFVTEAEVNGAKKTLAKRTASKGK